MLSITSKLAESLSIVDRPGDFFVSGTAEMLAPQLEVEGVGRIALPLLPVQAEQLITVAERAPYGRGENTLTDPSVRRTWQIGAKQVRIGGKHWERTLKTILARVAHGLGVAEPIVAEFYKLLLYDPGSFFVSHRDTEKAPGMFATLVLVLPSSSTGGELVVRHKGREVRLDLHSEDPAEAAFTAFYADCVHEVLPVMAGYRLTLVYNLLRRGKGPRPEPPSYAREQARLAKLLQSWVAEKQTPDSDAPEKLVYLLEHAYTPAELGFEKLKGADAAAAGVLAAAARPSDCDLHLALMTVTEGGIAEYTDTYGSGGWWSEEEEDEDEMKAVEVTDRQVTLSEWRPDDSRLALSEIPVEKEELSPPGALDELEPDEERFHEATGNEGASFERTYRRAALVLWPRERIFAVLSQAGLPVTLPYLTDLVGRWEASGEGQQSPLWLQAHDLSGHMLSRWPIQEVYGWRRETPSETAPMLMLLTRLKDTARLDTFLAEIAVHGLDDKSANTAVLSALDLLPRKRASVLLERIMAGSAGISLDVCGDLLARAVAAWPPDHRTDLIRAAAALIERLPGDPARAAPKEPWRWAPDMEPEFLVDLFTALEQIDKTLAERAADYILIWPKIYSLDTVLIPAVVKLLKSSGVGSSTAVQRLREACFEHLRTRLAEPLEAPSDWSRARVLKCRCPHCTDLSRFLADPERKVWTLKAVETVRRHVEATIQEARCDLDMATDRQKRPYSLVCTKNQASYERRVKQHKKDLANLKKLEA
jgi:predicted 2-oxoglutarate/Fe(II)-dependent dioxygenase YbiX